MIGQRPKRFTGFLVIAVFAAVLGVIAFAAVDVSSEAEPSWLEKRLATALLGMKLRANRPTKLSPLAPTEQDLERGSDIYREQWLLSWRDSRKDRALWQVTLPAPATICD